MKIAICDDREDERGAFKALLETYGQDCGIVFRNITAEK